MTCRSMLLAFRDRRLGGIAAVAVPLLVALAFAAPSQAMRTLSSDTGDADPCAQAGIGDGGGTAIKRNIAGKDSPKPVDIMLQCSPLMEMHAGIKLADDLVRDNYRGLDRYGPFFEGGVFRTPAAFPAWLNTEGFPFIHGNIAEQLRLQNLQASDAIRNALIAAAGGLTGALAVSGIVCAVGGFPTLGISCAGAAAALGGATVSAITSAAGSVIKDFITAQYNRIKAMGDADWFVWSNTKVFWDSFGSISDTTINPSLVDPNVNPFHKDLVRIGVEYSNVPLGQGPEFFGAKSGGSRSLAPVGVHQVGTNGHDMLTGGSRNDTLLGLNGNDVLRGGAGDDNLLGGAGNDVLYGGPGNDTLYGGRGNDVLHGGPGNNILVGGPGRDTIYGGPGADTIVDTSGPDTMYTGADNGRGKDFVNVRDGRGDDTVICQTRRSIVIADAGDRVLGPCGTVIRRGPILRLPQ